MTTPAPDDVRQAMTTEGESRMPGTTMLTAYSMSIEDALSVVHSRVGLDALTQHGGEESRRPAAAALEARAYGVAPRYVARLDIEWESLLRGFKIIGGGKRND